ncbi:nodulation efficiency protein D [Centipeda periodontii DSM 2778]|uniref:Nodulation efficiency protein D n=1 Tax=Centipeda periodontii DSM 2778 TaxID=888060 RepID=F5RPV0_9FIRM|nr:NfeD family protein [Centipeda periodontii]EGK57460.1 nodulation efficiency protein D [Centipeda periodontii DSM 2778]
MNFIVDNGVLQVLLLAVMFLSIMVEVKTGGLGVGVLLGIVAAAVFWGGQYTRGLVELYHIAVFLAGVLMIIVEILLPTVGLLAGLGVAAMLYSIVLALGGDIGALTALGIALIISVVLFLLIVSRLPSNKLWNKVVLQNRSRTEEGFVSAVGKPELVGKSGEVLTELRPSGTARIDGRPVDVISEGAYIQKGKHIVVLSVNGSRVVVREV